MSANRIYATWFRLITQLWPAERKTRRQNLALLVAGLVVSQSVFLSRVANALPNPVQLLSRTRRLDRFLENPAFCVRAWYEPLVRPLLARPPAEQPLRLILDATHIAFAHQLLLVSLAYRRRVLPLAWEWVPYSRGRTPATQPLRLLRYVATLLPPGAAVLLIGDAAFGSAPLLRWLDQQGWQYVLRLNGRVQVRPHPAAAWIAFRRLARRGERHWRPGWFSIEKQPVQANLVAYWQASAAAPWLLITNLPTCAQAVRQYGRRMWTEETFGDLKGHGFHLDQSHLRDAEKLSRLAFAVFLLYLQFLTEGTRVVCQGLRAQVDRADRRDLSLFQLGWRMWQRLAVNDGSFLILLNPFRFR